MVLPDLLKEPLNTLDAPYKQFVFSFLAIF